MRRLLMILAVVLGCMTAQGQVVVVQGQVSQNLGSVAIPMPGQGVTIQVGVGSTTTTLTDSTGFYSAVIALPVLSPNAIIQVSTLCPTGGMLVQSAPLSPATSTYQIDLACGSGGGGGNAMVSVSGVLQWPSGPATSGQPIQFFDANSTTP